MLYKNILGLELQQECEKEKLHPLHMRKLGAVWMQRMPRKANQLLVKLQCHLAEK